MVKEEETKDKIDWQKIATELNVGVNDCVYKHAWLTDTQWEPDDEEKLRDWWEYHDKDE